ncbi:MAG: hypothetical protein FWC26_10030, partial [Fibromonadales bacterium]|nr:hypothetical protein [Fibromonadales bacterium]
MKKLKFVLLLAGVMLAVIFTISCTGEDGVDGKDGASCVLEPNTTSGFDVVCGGLNVGELSNGKNGSDMDCIFESKPQTDSLLIICNNELVGVLMNGKNGADGEKGADGVDGAAGADGA